MTSLVETFRTRAEAANGRVGAVVLDAEGRAILEMRADEEFPAASVIKLPLVMTLYADAAARRLSLEERIAVGPRVTGSGVLSHLADVESMSLRDLAALTMTVSDNTAANRLIELVRPERVNERLDEWGCPATRLRRAMFDLEAKARGMENVMTPRETASLLSRLLHGSDEGPALLQLMEWNSDRTRLGRYLPDGVTLAHKDGWMEKIDNDTGVVRSRVAIVVAGFTTGLDPLNARPLLGLLGLAAASLAGAELRELPREARG